MPLAPPQIPGLTDWRALARGGFAVVWQARQETLNRLVAVKVDQRKLNDESEQQRFLREAGAAGRMSGHPGIVTVHDAGILSDDRPYLVMELCPGGSLTRWMSADPPPSQRDVRDVGVRIADALAATHERGVLHRDVKPANILIDAYGNAGLADFGLAALPDPGGALRDTMEAITPAYAPPEVFRREPLTEAGDVYSLAATLYAVLSGRPPRWAETARTPSVPEILERQRVPIRRIPGVDRAFMDLLLEAMADDPADRPSAARFRDRLTALNLSTRAVARPLDAPPVPAPPPAPTLPMLASAVQPPQLRAGPRLRTIVLIAAGLAVALIVGLVIALTSLRGPEATGSPSPETTVGPSSSAPPTPSPTVPAGFVDCSPQLGATTFCAKAAECWGGIFSYADQPNLGTPARCAANHVYQTFAAGPLAYEVRSQSRLQADPRVKRVCTRAVANSMLSPSDRRSDWEVFALGPQKDDDGSWYRCIFGRGERSRPLALTVPN